MSLKNRVLQIGIVVKDIERSREAWAKLLGVGVPDWVETESEEVTKMRYRGKPSEGRAKLAFISLENVSIELIEPIGGPSTWSDFLEKHGEGVHHIAFEVDDMERSTEELSKIGIDVEQSGDFTGGSYAYARSEIGLGVILELLAKR
ncbi:MAG: VOC family protein [Candidatus Brockarchaeota archaeon]|nr:VOC family protein [Candidatus Brockarchaeota archaeon]